MPLVLLEELNPVSLLLPSPSLEIPGSVPLWVEGPGDAEEELDFQLTLVLEQSLLVDETLSDLWLPLDFRLELSASELLSDFWSTSCFEELFLELWLLSTLWLSLVLWLLLVMFCCFALLF